MIWHVFYFKSIMPSTVIANIRYDALSHTLRIEFLSGAVYDYKHVPEKIYKSMISSGSKGQYLNEHIKGNYEFEKVS
jgi:hypothetical protein